MGSVGIWDGYFSLGRAVLGKGSVLPHDKMIWFDSRQWRTSVGVLGLPVAFGCGVDLRPMVVTIWSHLWVVSGPARSLSITVLVSGPFAGSYRRMGWAVLG